MKGCLGRIIIFLFILLILAIALPIGLWVIGAILAIVAAFWRAIFR
jgi:hypothetical protein